MKNYKHLLNKTVQFKKKIEDSETEVDDGMRMRLISIHEKSGCLNIFFDSSGFIEHNKTKMKSNYWHPETREPTLTALEAGWWPESEKHSIYFELDFNPSEYFNVIEGDYEFVATIQGGIGEDVWDKEIEVKANDMLEAAQLVDDIVYGEYSRRDVIITSIEQIN